MDQTDEDEAGGQGDVARVSASLGSGTEGPCFSWQRLLMFAGPGLLISIAYVDPGNLESDLQTGYQGGYTLGWLIVWSTVLGFIVQLLAVRLGVVTRKHLALHCRAVYPTLPRCVLWTMAEVAIIGSDIQEVIGSAIAINLIGIVAFDVSIPLWAGVLMTGVDTFLLLTLERLGVRWLEAFFAVLVTTMTMSFGWMYFKADCNTTALLLGAAVPTLKYEEPPCLCAAHHHAHVLSCKMVQGTMGLDIVLASDVQRFSTMAVQFRRPLCRWEYLSTALGIVGALVMPHNSFLHSALVLSRNVRIDSDVSKSEAIMYNAVESALSLAVTIVINLCVMAVFAAGFHGQNKGDIGLSTAGQYLGEEFGEAMKIIWAIGLFAAGQSSTMTGTYTGQFVMSGFMKLHLSPFKRALITRSVALVPTLLVAVLCTGSNKLDQLSQGLNVLQSMQLPFALLPLLYVSTRKDIMGSNFVLRSRFRVSVQVMCGLLLVIKLYVVSTTLTSISHHAWLTLTTVVVCAAYIAFVVYLLLGPRRVHSMLATWLSIVSASILATAMAFSTWEPSHSLV